ncbi:MAG: hypothetical protein R3F45_09310 [Gammaproteobacteria bacterium]
MSKKSLPVGMSDEAAWREGDEEPGEGYSEAPAVKSTKNRPGKPSRQRIEEYFERKRLAEALQEELGEDFFQRLSL